MKKVLVVGAGAQGGPCASILSREQSVQEIRLGDLNHSFVDKVATRIDSPKIKPMQLDASQKGQMIKAAEDVDVIFNFTPIEFNDLIMEAAVACRAHYVDTACNLDFLERWISGKKPKYHQEFIDNDRTALAGCGFSPGTANVITRYICDQLDTIKRIIIRVGRSSVKDSDEVVSGWEPTWSPEILLEDYADPPLVFSGGKYLEVPIFSNPERYSFPAPVGEILLSSHSHEEPYTIPGFYLDKGLQEVDFKYPVDKLAGAFVKMGFAEQQAINVKGVQVAPRDVLMELVKRPRNLFLDEDESTIEEVSLTGIIDVSVDGTRDQEGISHIISYKFTDGKDKPLKRKLYDTYGTTRVYVALPAVVGAKLCVSGAAEKGVITPDSLLPESFFEGMAQHGVPFRFEERIVKQTTVID